MNSQFVCVELVDNVCQRWQEFSLLPPLDKGEGLEIGWTFLSITIIAWSVRLMVKYLILGWR